MRIKARSFRSMTLISLLMFVTILCMAGVSFAQNAQQAVSLNMFADKKMVSNSEDLNLTIEFNIADDWHIYGQKIKETGLPTKLSLTADDASKVAKQNWPPPKKIKNALGEVVDVYTRRLVVKIPVKPLPKANQAKIHYKASASWLACNESLCVPGEQEVQLVVSVGS